MKNKILIPLLISLLVVSTAWFVVPTPDAYAQSPRKVRLFAGFKLVIQKTKLKLVHITTAGGDSPPTVTTNAADWIHPTGARLNGTINTGTATTRGFAYSQVSDLSSGVSTTTESGSFGPGVFQDCINDEVAGTYYFRAYATNAGGTGYGGILDFVTEEGASCA